MTIAGRPLDEVSRQIRRGMKLPAVEYTMLHDGDRWAWKLGYKPSEWDALSADDKARLITTVIIEDEIELCLNSWEKYHPAVGKRAIDLEAEIDRLFGDDDDLHAPSHGPQRGSTASGNPQGHEKRVLLGGASHPRSAR